MACYPIQLPPCSPLPQPAHNSSPGLCWEHGILVLTRLDSCHPMYGGAEFAVHCVLLGNCTCLFHGGAREGLALTGLAESFIAGLQKGVTVRAKGNL